MNQPYYMPLTAAPFRKENEYQETVPDHPELAKYIRCFWGSKTPYRKETPSPCSGLVIPDTCTDIIYTVDYTANTITGNFCGINDTSFLHCDQTPDGHLVSTFAIRFYAWKTYAFAEDSMERTMNGFFDIPSRFSWLDHAMRHLLWKYHFMQQRRKAVEQLFLNRLPQTKEQSVIENAVIRILMQKGVQQTGQLAKDCFISARQLERLFQKYIGITPKKLCSLIRYQFLWSDILQSKEFYTLDAVTKYGYTDQSHLLHEFKRYHTMNITSAVEYAYRGAKNI